MSARCSFAVDTAAVAADLDREGHAVVPGLLDAATAEELVAGFDDDQRYRSTIDMARHGYGVGTYRYFAYPLPPTVAALREQLYRQLVPIADEWAERLGTGERYPDGLAEFLDRCAAAGQERPTPLILRYRPGHYNCLHQDRYGEVAFPLQVAILLTRAPSSTVASWCWSSSGRGRSPAPTWCRSSTATRWSSRTRSARRSAPAARTGCTSAMASPPSGAVGGTCSA